MDHHVGVLFQNFFRVRGDGHAPWRILCANDFSQIMADFGGIGVDGADNFNGLFFPHQARDGSADGSDTKLDGANFLFQLVLRLFAAQAALRPARL